jgi:hypothetical protein
VDLPEKGRPEKLLGMLGSAFVGERANAARLIGNMADTRRLTIIELIYGSAPVRAASRRTPKTEKPSGDTMLQSLRDTVSGDISDLEFVITQWECDFASEVAKRWLAYELSEQQIIVAEKIIGKVELARAAR